MRLFRSLLVCLALAAAPLAADEGGAWAPVGPGGGNVTALAAAPSRPSVVYAGLDRTGIFQSLDRGRTWTRGGLRGQTFHDLAVDPTNPARVFAATGKGLFRSTDRGLTWTTAGARPAGVRALVFAPGRAGVLYAGADTGLWKSADSGGTWRRVSASPGRITALAVDPRASRVLWAGLASGALFRSADGGVTWQRRRLGGSRLDERRPVAAIAVDPVEPSTVYAGVGGELLRSPDRGESWTRTGTGLLGEVEALEATRSGLLAGTSFSLFLSSDRGSTFRISHRGLAPLVAWDLEMDRQDPPRLYLQVGGSVLASADHGANWISVGPTLPLDSQSLSGLPSMAVAPDDSGTLYLSEGRTVARSTDGGRTWTTFRQLCTLLSDLVLDPRENTHLLAIGRGLSGCSRIPSAILRSEDGGESWSQLTGPDWGVLAVDPFDSSIYIQQLSSGDLWRFSTVPGGVPLSPGLSATAFAASTLKLGTLWAGRTGEVGRSRDGGRTWTFSSAGLPEGAAVTELAPDPADAETLYAATVEQGVFRSDDSGETWSPVGAWPAGVRLQGGLVVDPADPSILFAGTNAGVLKLDQED